MGKIQYVIGDATNPELGDQHGIIVHCCNDVGGWGAGFVLALSKRWKEPEKYYRLWSNGEKAFSPFDLGEVTFVSVEPDITVANLIGQHKTGLSAGKPPIRYDAIREGFSKIAYTIFNDDWAKRSKIHMPRIGCGLAGGKWEIIEKIIQEEFCDKDIEVIVYDLR